MFQNSNKFLKTFLFNQKLQQPLINWIFWDLFRGLRNDYLINLSFPFGNLLEVIRKCDSCGIFIVGFRIRPSCTVVLILRTIWALSLILIGFDIFFWWKRNGNIGCVLVAFLCTLRSTFHIHVIFSTLFVLLSRIIIAPWILHIREILIIVANLGALFSLFIVYFAFSLFSQILGRKSLLNQMFKNLELIQQIQIGLARSQIDESLHHEA